MTPIGKALLVMIGLAILTAFFMAVFIKPKPTGGTMAYHRINLDTEEDVSFTDKETLINSIGWSADGPDMFKPSGWKCRKDGESAQPCGFRSQQSGYQVAACEECVRTQKSDIDAVRTYLNNHLP